jgi:hypothetical protein
MPDLDLRIGPASSHTTVTKVRAGTSYSLAHGPNISVTAMRPAATRVRGRVARGRQAYGLVRTCWNASGRYGAVPRAWRSMLPPQVSLGEDSACPDDVVGSLTVGKCAE